MQAVNETECTAGTGRVHLAVTIDSMLTREALRAAVEKARDAVDPRDRDRIEYAPPMRVKAPLPTLAFASGCGSFAVALLTHLVQAHKGGTIIDLREKTPLVSWDANLQRHIIRVVVTNGSDHIRAASLSEAALGAIPEGVVRLPEAKGGEGVRKEDVEAVIHKASSMA